MAKKQNGISPTLAALTSAAMTLPGIASKAKAEVGASDPKYSIQYTRYNEDSIPSGDAVLGDRDRYEIDVVQMEFIYPINDKWQLSSGFIYDDMSGSSPWWIQPDTSNAGNDPQVVLSGATIDDTRYDTRVRLDYFGEKFSIAPSLAYSTERDYDSISAGIEVGYELPNKTTSIKGGVSASFDEIDPTQLEGVVRVNNEDKENYTLFGTLTQVINKNTILQTTLGLSYFDGYLSDPYKRAWVDFQTVPDSRPDDRTQYTWSARLRRYSNLLNAALQADYRFYIDDWEVRSHTLEVGINKATANGWTFDSSIRYYSQTQAEFYEPFYTALRSDGYHSSDYRLSPYGSIAFRVGLSEQIGDWRVKAAVERYISDKSYSFQKVDVENPSLVDFTQFTFGVDYTF